jgi:hypothetical protein
MSGTYRFLLRMPPAVRDHLQDAIAGTGRSLNQEVVGRLEQSLDEDERRGRSERRRRLLGIVLWCGTALAAIALAAWAAVQAL